eukprot:XP_001611536.1 hypothetical protein [Babesia bovis T2Bo]
MMRQTPLINRPEMADMMELGQGVKKRLSKDERVAFVGYRMPHPLENKLEIRLRCKVDSPFTVMLNAISSVRLNIGHLKKVYLSTLREKGARL